MMSILSPSAMLYGAIGGVVIVTAAAKITAYINDNKSVSYYHFVVRDLARQCKALPSSGAEHPSPLTDVQRRACAHISGQRFHQAGLFARRDHVPEQLTREMNIVENVYGPVDPREFLLPHELAAFEREQTRHT